MLASMFINGGVIALKNADQMAVRADPVASRLTPLVERATSVPMTLNTKQLVQMNAAVHILGGSMLAAGKVPRITAFALAASLVPTTLAGHRFWEQSDPQQRTNQRLHFLKNVSAMGGLLIAGVDTEGKPSLAWRAQRQAEKARRRAARADRTGRVKQRTSRRKAG